MRPTRKFLRLVYGIVVQAAVLSVTPTSANAEYMAIPFRDGTYNLDIPSRLKFVRWNSIGTEIYFSLDGADKLKDNAPLMKIMTLRRGSFGRMFSFSRKGEVSEDENSKMVITDYIISPYSHIVENTLIYKTDKQEFYSTINLLADDKVNDSIYIWLNITCRSCDSEMKAFVLEAAKSVGDYRPAQ